jgi:hypothetical protein
MLFFFGVLESQAYVPYRASLRRPRPHYLANAYPILV